MSKKVSLLNLTISLLVIFFVAGYFFYRNNQNIKMYSPGSIESEFGVYYELPNGWKRYLNETDHNLLKLPETLPTPNEVATDLTGCVFYVGKGWAREGPYLPMTNEEIFLEGKSFTKRSWYQDERKIPFFSYYFSDEMDVNYDLKPIYAFIPKDSDQKCQENIEFILSTVKFTELP